MNTANDQSPWYINSAEIARLLRWMNDHDEYGPIDVETCIEVVETPWSWTDEHQQMLAVQAGAMEPALEASVTLARAGVRRFR